MLLLLLLLWCCSISSVFDIDVVVVVGMVILGRLALVLLLLV